MTTVFRVLFGLVALAGGAFLVRTGLMSLKDWRSRKDRLVRVAGKLVDKREYRSERSSPTTYYATVEWEDLLGETREREFRVGSEHHWEYERIFLFLDPEEPRYALVDRGSGDSRFIGWIVLGVLILSLGLLLCVRLLI